MSDSSHTSIRHGTATDGSVRPLQALSGWSACGKRSYPRRGFAALEEARRWVTEFVRWYNDEHLHSAIRFVTPSQRHDGDDADLLRRRHQVYEAARLRHPARWTGRTRNWTPATEVYLNPVDPADHVGRRADR